MMMWMWISATVILLGAELNAEIEHQTARDSTVGVEKPLGRRGAVMADTVGAAEGLKSSRGALDSRWLGPSGLRLESGPHYAPQLARRVTPPHPGPLTPSSAPAVACGMGGK